MIDQDEIHNKCLSDDPEERIKVLEQLRDDFSSLQDKQKVWDDLIVLINSNHSSDVKAKIDRVLCHLFPHLPDKQKAWDDLMDSIIYCDIFELTCDEINFVHYTSFYSLRFAFPHVPNKQQAWSDLIKLINHEYFWVRNRAGSALDSAFPYVPDKQQAWNDLIRLTKDKDEIVRFWAALALGSAFSRVPDKQQVWNDLIKLTNDNDSSVRASSNHSLGRISILKASQTNKEEDYKKELEKAIEFFEIATKKFESYNPAQFCLPFYRSFHTIVFKKKEAKEEVDKYLTEAKDAIKGSTSKKILFEIVENLANALEEVKNIEKMDLQTMKGELDFYRKYLNHAEELMRDTEEKAPYATAAMRKGLPILDRNLKELLEEIQNKAKIACQVSQGTPIQEIACAINQEVQKWEIGSQEEMTQMIENLAYILEEKISIQPKNQYILGKIDQMKSERNLVRQYEILAQIIPLIRNVTVVPLESVLEKIEGSQREVLEEIRKVGDKLDEVIISLEPGISEELILHLGYITSAGGVEYTLTIPLQELSCSDIKEEFKEIAGKRISQLAMLPNKVRKILEDYLVKNKMEDLLNRLR